MSRDYVLVTLLRYLEYTMIVLIMLQSFLSCNDGAVIIWMHSTVIHSVNKDFSRIDKRHMDALKCLESTTSFHDHDYMFHA